MFHFNKKTTPTELIDELERFVVFWLGPRREDYGEPAETLNHLELPEPLRRLYAFAGRWPGVTGRDEICEKYGWVSIFSTQDMLLRPSRLEWSDDGNVQFIVENQGVWSLATQSSGADPPVWIDTEELGLAECDKWPKANDSLAHLLTTFCLQELTFGARFGVWDSKLSQFFKSGQAKITSLWLNAHYVWPESEYNFYLMDDDVLVGHFPGDDDSYFFGANSESGIARIQANESPIVTLRLRTPTEWTVEVQRDGSGKVGVFMQQQSEAKFPAGTFNFSTLRDGLLACQTESGDSRTTPLVFFMRSGRGYAEGRGVADWGLVTQVINKAISAGIEKEPRFDICCREIPFGD